MIKLIQSERLKLPIVYLIECYNDLKELPIGIPFIRASLKDYSKCVRMLEWEVLWKACKASGLPFNWRKILQEHGYTEVTSYGVSTYGGGEANQDFEGDLSESILTPEDEKEFGITTETMGEFLNDASYKVDIEMLKSLRLLPSWLDDIETAVKENVTNAIVFNPSLYTKKLDLPLGGIEYSPAQRSVIIIDISGSIPESVSRTMLILSKTLTEQFYADLLITGSKSTLYDYTNLDALDINTIYSENEMDNDQVYFKALLKEPRKYKTAIVFGDNDAPGYHWRNTYNKRTVNITDEQGKKLCNWEVKEVMSFHTKSNSEIAGYARWFSPEKITYKEGWVKYLN